MFPSLFCAAVCCCCCHRQVRMNHSDVPNNPLKLIWRVVQFSMRNKEHIFRSAFTYNEMPSRLDLAKQRYGRPFTTREVEDVKNFCQICVLLLSLTGFQLIHDTTVLSTLVMTNFFLQFLGYHWLSHYCVYSCLPTHHTAIFFQMRSQDAHKNEDRSGCWVSVVACYNCDQSPDF